MLGLDIQKILKGSQQLEEKLKMFTLRHTFKKLQPKNGDI